MTTAVAALNMSEKLSALDHAIADAQRDGCSSTHGRNIFKPELLDSIHAAGDEFLGRALADPEKYGLASKRFLMSSRGDPMSPAHPLRQAVGAVQKAIDRISDVPMACFSTEFWATVPSGADFKLSQVWHRDHEATPLWKLFLQLSDIGPENGPLEYVRGSHRGDYDLCPKQAYPGHEIEVPAERVTTWTVPKGVGVFADTGGIHRGGRVTAGQRLQAVWAFLPKNSPLWYRALKGGGR